MSKADKLLARLLSLPRDFTWDELLTVMTKHGFALHPGSGSRRKFVHEESGLTVAMHEPHPGRIMKPYALRLAIDGLKQIGVIK